MSEMKMVMQRVIHPGWLTCHFEDESEGTWEVYHKCICCGFTLEGKSGGSDEMMNHTKKKHPGEAFGLELYRFRSAVHRRDLYYGLEIFEWPDTCNNGYPYGATGAVETHKNSL